MRENRANIIWAGVFLLALGPLCWLLFLLGGASEPATPASSTPRDFKAVVCAVTTIANGGPRLSHPSLVPPGVYSEPIDGTRLQHSLTHGSTVVFYAPPLTEATKARLAALRDVVAVPQPGLPVGRVQAARLGEQIVCPSDGETAWRELRAWLG
jgi:Protein of unknown function (DUF3105)